MEKNEEMKDKKREKNDKIHQSPQGERETRRGKNERKKTRWQIITSVTQFSGPTRDVRSLSAPLFRYFILDIWYPPPSPPPTNELLSSCHTGSWWISQNANAELTQQKIISQKNTFLFFEFTQTWTSIYSVLMAQRVLMSRRSKDSLSFKFPVFCLQMPSCALFE